MTLTKYEQETVIVFNSGSADAQIYMACPQVMKKLVRLAEYYPEQYRLIEQTDISKKYSCSKRLINFRKPRNENNEERELKSRRMKKLILLKRIKTFEQLQLSCGLFFVSKFRKGEYLP